ncbi:hydroxymethylbilane synthase [Actinomyces naeslundii]|uniref:hydroxymethylbilane synthase n=1 Tax=Actinomyces naeslundii TaxID=1655 RepID=UPI00096C18CD|nr:hydroxymethylbilane synthase [Actinomyces naeslundii]
MTTAGTDSGRIRLGTRGSRLALTQSGQVAEALMAAGAPGEGSGARRDGLDIELVTVRTDGDGDRTPLRSLGGVGVFAARLRHALLDGEVDLVVHSFKDLPTQPVEGLEVICVPPREDPRDALCARDGLTLATLPDGARVGTGSPRRAAQLLAARPDLEVVDLRGNVPTRLARVRGLEAVGVGADEPVAPSRADAAGDLDAVVLALSGLRRLGLEHCASEVLDLEMMLPAPAQGALAVETRAGALEAREGGGISKSAETAGDSENPQRSENEEAAASSTALARAVAALDDEPTRLAVTAERSLMARLGAGCAAPVGAWAHLRGGEQERREDCDEREAGWNETFCRYDTAMSGTRRGAGCASSSRQSDGAAAGRADEGERTRSDDGKADRGAGDGQPHGGTTSRRSPRVLVLRAVVTSLDGGQEVGCELSTELPGTAGGSGSPREAAAAVRAAEALGVRVAEILLEDGAGDIVDLHANKPRRD